MKLDEDTIEDLANQIAFSAVDTKSWILNAGTINYRRKDNSLIVLNDDISESLFEASCIAFKNSKQFKTISLLIGNLGSSDLINPKKNQEDYLPEGYQEIILKYNLVSELELYFENTFRNRGSRSLKKFYSNNKIVKMGDTYFIHPIKFNTCLSELSNISKKGIVPICRTIMAEFLKEQEKRGYQSAFNVIYDKDFYCSGIFSSIYKKLYEGKMDIINFNFSSGTQTGQINVIK